LIQYAYSRGYELTLGEAYVQTPRKCRDGKFVEDGVHMPSSLHYTRLAIDLNLFVSGGYVIRSDDMAWIDLGSFWKALHPELTWGGDFGDANHFSGGYVIRSDDMAWIDLGSYWKALHPELTWGGDFGDANHFSVGFNGRK